MIPYHILNIQVYNAEKNIEEICTFYKMPKHVLSNVDRKRISKLKKANPDKWESLTLPIKNSSMGNVISSWENISIASILNDINLNQKDMESWLTIVMQEKNIDAEATELSKDSMEIYALGLCLIITLRAYKTLRKNLLQFTVSFGERVSLTDIIKDNRKLQMQLEEERKAASEKLAKVEKELHLNLVGLEKEIRKQNQKINSMEDDQKELIAIREYLFSSQEDESEYLAAEDDFSVLLDKKICIVGGPLSWQKGLKEKFPKWKYLDKSALNFDKNIFQNIDSVYINTFRLNHPFYYKVTSALHNKSIQMHFVKNTNIHLFLQQVKSDIRGF